ncbi:MAG: DUF4190 domain-containing protein [Candidatus Saccharimonadales bacterium]
MTKKTDDLKNIPVSPVAKVPTPTAAQSPQAPASVITVKEDTTLATVSMVLGIVSFFGFGLLLGIPAIITGSIALKRKYPGHGMSLAGVITGAISSLLSILFIGLWVVIVIFAINHPQTHDYNPNSIDQGSTQMHIEPFQT